MQNNILKNKEKQAINASVVQLIVVSLYQRNKLPHRLLSLSPILLFIHPVDIYWTRSVCQASCPTLGKQKWKTCALLCGNLGARTCMTSQETSAVMETRALNSARELSLLKRGWCPGLGEQEVRKDVIQGGFEEGQVGILRRQSRKMKQLYETAVRTNGRESVLDRCDRIAHHCWLLFWWWGLRI